MIRRLGAAPALVVSSIHSLATTRRARSPANKASRRKDRQLMPHQRPEGYMTAGPGDQLLNLICQRTDDFSVDSRSSTAVWGSSSQSSPSTVGVPFALNARWSIGRSITVNVTDVASGLMRTQGFKRYGSRCVPQVVVLATGRALATTAKQRANRVV
jgi:hypothetical protein